MKTKLLKTIPFIMIILSFFALPVCAEEYIFTTTESFPVLYSDSIEVVNYDHNVYTAESLEDIEYLIDAGIVDYFEPMSYSELFDYTTNDTYYSEQTNLNRISTQFAWNKGVFGDTVKVAVIDSGIYNAAADFTTKNVIKVKDYTATASSTITYCNDEIGHGTMVAGIIAATHNTRGVAGIAPNVELYIYKCFYLNEYGKQTAKNSDIIAAAYDAIDTYGVDIINLSSGTTNKTVFKEVSDYAEKKGVLIVSAVGNDGSLSGDTIYYPASYDNVIGVGSTKADGHRASHSQRNDFVDIMAPGEEIYSVRISGYEKGSGTSFATPHIVGALALAKSLNPDLTFKELTNALYTTADAMEDRYSGHGQVNVQALLTYVKATLSPGDLVFSTAAHAKYAYRIPVDDYVSYFARYDDDIMTEITETGVHHLDDYTHYIWKKGTLTPYEGDITKIEY